MMPDSLTHKKYISPIQFFNVYRTMDEIVGEHCLGENMNEYTAYLAMKYYVRAIGCNVTVIPFKSRLSLIIKILSFLFTSHIIRKYNLRIFGWVYESFLYYLRKATKR